VRNKKQKKMGLILNKSKKASINKVNNLSSKVEAENILYRPISHFTWKDASPSEMHKEAIANYATRFAL
jgi:hypothetical protein